MTDLSALLESSKALTAHLSRRDLPSVNLSLDQIEAQSRRLVSRQPGTSADNDRAYAVSSYIPQSNALTNPTGTTSSPKLMSTRRR